MTAVQVSHPSAFKGYEFGRCPQCNKKALYLLASPSGERLFRCRSCQWSHLDGDAENAKVTMAFYETGTLRSV